MVAPVVVAELPLDRVAPSQTSRFSLELSHDELGGKHHVPVIVCQGREPGPVMAVTAVVHGNELNGMRALHRLLAAPSVTALARGTLVAVPVVNVPGYRRHERAFTTGKDINRYVAEDPDGGPTQRYAWALASKLVTRCDVFLDLHTAGPGRRNTFYARVDLDDEPSASVARCIAPAIIAHKPAREKTFRHFAASRGVPAVVLEIGDPSCFQDALIARAAEGMQRLLADRGMIDDAPPAPASPFECRDSHWERATTGGTACLHVSLGARIEAGETLATIVDLWGDERERVIASHNGVVIGMIRRPPVMEGSPLVHIGIQPGDHSP